MTSEEQASPIAANRALPDESWFQSFQKFQSFQPLLNPPPRIKEGEDYSSEYTLREILWVMNSDKCSRAR
jgi:hypothetical protein